MKQAVRIVLGLFICIFFGSLSAQTIDWQWSYGYGSNSQDYGQDIMIDDAGSVFVTGRFQGTTIFGSTSLTSSGYDDAFIAKLDGQGNYIWVKKAGGTSYDIGYSISTDNVGNCYVAGYFQGTSTFGSINLSAGAGDIFVTKLNAEGDFLWAKKAGWGSSNDRGYGIAVDSAGNSYVTGYFTGTATFGSFSLISNGGNDVFVAKLDTNGNWLWATKAGGTTHDYGYSVDIDSSGSIYVTGCILSTASFGDITLTSSSMDIFVGKLDSSGNWLWAKRVGGSQTGDCGYGLTTDINGNSYITGSFLGSATFDTITLSSSGNYDVFVAKIDTNGSWQWAKKIGGTGSDIGLAIGLDIDGNSYVTGSFSGSVLFGTTNLTSIGGKDLFCAKFDNSGNTIRAHGVGAVSNDEGYSITIDSSGNSYITGYFSDGATFGNVILPSNGSYDIFVAKLGLTLEDELSALVQTLDFGLVCLEATSTSQITISNNGYADGYITSASIDNPSFSFVSPPSLPLLVPAGGSVNIGIQFSPSVAGLHNGTLSLSGSNNFSASITLSGTGEEPPLLPILSVSTNVLEFGSIFPGSMTSNHFTINNTGDGDGIITNAWIDDPAFYISSTAFPLWIPAHSSVDVYLDFSSGIIGAHIGNLTLSNDQGYYENIQLSGFVEDPWPYPSFSVGTTEIAFGVVGLYNTAIQTVEVYNYGNYPGSVLIALNDTQSNFTVSMYRDGNATNNVVNSAANASREPFYLDVPPMSMSSFYVTYDPASPGLHDAQIQMSGDPDFSHTITLTGSCITASFWVEPLSIDFGTMFELDPIMPANVTIYNSSGVDGYIQAISVSTGNFNVFNFELPLFITAGSYQTITVEMNPLPAGSYSGILTVIGDDNVELNISLSGTVMPRLPMFGFSVSELDFGFELFGGVSYQSVTVRNDGMGLGTFSLSLSGNASFSIDDSFPYSNWLEPGQTTEIIIKYQPINNDVHQGTLILSCAGVPDITASINGNCSHDGDFGWQWVSAMANTGYSDGNSMNIDPMGNIITTGYYSFYQRMDENEVQRDNYFSFFVNKANPNGTTLWSAGVTGQGHIRSNAVVCDAQGNSYITGLFYGSFLFGTDTITSIDNSNDVFVAKIDPNGNWLWAISAGGMDWDEAYGIAIDLAGNIVITGNIEAAASFGEFNLPYIGYSSDMFIAKLSPAGSWIWAKSFGSTGQDWSYAIAPDNNGNYLVTGRANTAVNFGDGVSISSGGYFTAKINSTGTWLWAIRTAGGNSICVDSDNNAIIIAESFTIYKVSEAGVVTWTRNVSGSANGRAVAVDSSGNIFVAGTFSGNAEFGTIELCNYFPSLALAKLNSNGQWQWAVKACGAGSASLNYLSMDAGGNPIVWGNIQGGINFGQLYLDSSYNGSFIAKFAETNSNQTAQLVVSPTLIDFETVLVETDNQAEVIVSNTGSLTGFISGVNLNAHEYFSISDLSEFPIALTPGQSISIGVGYHPLLAGEHSGTITITGDWGFSQIITLQGIAEDAPVLLGEIVSNPSSISFGSKYIGSSTLSSVSLKNIGLAGAIITNVEKTGSVNFSIYSGSRSLDEINVLPQKERAFAPVTLLPGDSLIVTVVFHPFSEGVFSGDVTVSTDIPSQLSIPLSGTGVSYPYPLISVQPNPLQHTMQEQSVSTRTLEISNQGTQILTYNINTSSLPEWLTVEVSSAVVNPMDTGIVILRFNSQTLASNPPDTAYEDGYNYSLHILSNDPLNPDYTVNIQLLVVELQLQVEFSGTPLSGHAPLQIQFTDQSTINQDMGAASITGWRWDFENDGVIDSWVQHPSFTYSQPGIYSVKLTVITSNGLLRLLVKQNYITVMNSVPVIANPLPVINNMSEDVEWGPHPLIANTTTPNGIFSDADGDPLTFETINSNHIFVSIWNNQFELNSTLDWNGTETIRITAHDPFGQSVTQSIIVTVTPVNDAPVINLPSNMAFIRNSSFTVNFSPYIHDPDNSIENLSIVITPLTYPRNINFVYTPINEPSVPGQLTTVFSATPNWSGVESFFLLVNDNRGRAIGTAIFQLTVLQNFTVQMTASTGTAATIAFSGQTVNFMDRTVGNPNWWQWQFFCNGIPVQTSLLQNPSFSFTQAGSYDVHLLLGNSEAGVESELISPNLFSLSGTAVDNNNLPTTWTLLGSPYNLFGDVTIPANQSVQIEEDVVVNIFSEAPVEVTGSMIANNVVFQPQTDSGTWNGLVFNGNPRRSSSLQNCQIINAENPIQIMGSSPSINNLVIAPADTLVFFNQQAILLQGNSTPNLSNIQIVNYNTGLLLNNLVQSVPGVPILNNVQIRASQVDRRNSGDDNAVIISGNCNANLTNIQISNYNTGIVIDGINATSGNNPTISGVNIISPMQTRSLSTGIQLKGNAGAHLEDIDITDALTGMELIGDGILPQNTPTLTNVRIRNTNSALRTESVAILCREVAALQITDLETDGYAYGLSLQDSTLATISNYNLTNLNLNNSLQDTRQEKVGIKTIGAISLNLTDVEVANYQIGLKYDSGGADLLANTPTLTNVRIRNTSSTVRQPTIGMQLNNLKKVIVDNSEIIGCGVGLEIINDDLRGTSSPTLTNVRIRNTNSTVRSENIGMYLASQVRGKIQNCEIENAGIGIMIADGNLTELIYNKIKNCETGIRASGIEPPNPIKTQMVYVEADYYDDNPGYQFRAFELNYFGPWQIRNNTIWGYPCGLKSQSAQVNFTGNILWHDTTLITTPFNLLSSDLSQSYNDIAFANGIYPGTGNINAAPLFIDAANADFALHYNSPCIDAGSPLFLDSDGTVSDMGANSYQHQVGMNASARFIQTGSSVTFTNTTIGHDYPETIVEWDLGNNGIIDATSRDWTYQFNEPGIYDLRLNMTTGLLQDTKLYRAIVVAQTVNLKAPENVAISLAANNILLSWDAVTQTVENQPVTVPFYLVYASPNPYGVYEFVGFSENGLTQYLHLGGGGLAKSFYFVIGFSGSRGELLHFINENHGKTIRKPQSMNK